MNRNALLKAFAALALMGAATMVACSKDDDTSNQDAIVVNTAALYDEMGIRGEMSQALAGGDYVLTDTLLVYDASGSLVRKLGAESHNLEPLTFAAEGLADGSYTLVLWQTARSASGERVWRLGGEERLSTAVLNETRALLDYAFAAGYATTTVATKGGKLVPTLTPMAIGSIIDLRVDHFDAMPEATALSLWGTNIYYRTGIRLAPALDEDRRWYTDPDSALSGHVAQLPAGQTSGKFFTLYHGEGCPFELWMDQGEADDYVTHIGHASLRVGEQAVCYFDLGRSSWQPPFMGTPVDFAAWKTDRDAGIPVTNPLLQWGCSIDDVYDHVFSKMWYEAGNYKLEYWEDPYQSWHQWYKVSPRALTEQYLFETEDGQNLRYVECYCWDNNAPAELRDNLLQHQGFHNTGNTIQSNGNTFEQFLSADGGTEAWATFFDDGYWHILYRPSRGESSLPKKLLSRQ